MAGDRHSWKFFRVGGVDQVALRDGADLIHLDQLDRKLWVALAMPVHGVEFDARTLHLLDTDDDKRIRVPEVLAALKWVSEAFVDPDDLIKGGDTIALARIKDPVVRAGATRILGNLGKTGADSISLEDVADTAKIFAATKFNGDGIVPADAADDEVARRFIDDLIATQGSVLDRSGKPGIDQARVDVFSKEGQALVAWQELAGADAAIMPFGDATGAAVAAVAKVRVKIDDYFTRCQLAVMDPRAATAMNFTDSEFAALADKALSPESPEVARLPLAQIVPRRALPLESGLNPAWTAPIATLRSAALVPAGVTGDALTEADWSALKSKLSAHEKWLAARPVTVVEVLGLPRIRELLGGGAIAKVNELIKQDLALEEENKQITEVERLVRYQRDLVKLLNNFVNFSEFYRREFAVFQTGTLYLDARSCRLCLDVTDAAKHATLAGLSSAFLAYCECTRKGSEKRTIVAAFTDGDADNLVVGRNGVFFDRSGKDWDATITRIVSNPISVREAFWSPYKKFARAIEEQITRRATAADTESSSMLSTAATTVAHAGTPASPAPPRPRGIDVGTVAAIGVAVGGIGAMVTGILAAFFGLGFWMPIGLLALILLISCPSMLLAYLKLRQRNLGPILDANGWAINTRARVNVPFGAALTDVASVPVGSLRSLSDPYSDPRRPWRTWLSIAVVLLLGLGWFIGRLDRYLPPRVRSIRVLGTNAPAYAQPAAPGTTVQPAAVTPRP